MKKMMVSLCLFVIQTLWRLRYRVTYKGLDELKKQLQGTSHGTLFLPNHPAVFIDPLVISVPLIKAFATRPLVIEYMYYNPLFHWAVRLINALPIPNFSTGYNPIKLRRTERMLQKMSAGLKNGESFLIYPSGTTKVGPKEVIGGAFGAYKLISENPEANIVLVRLSGLWGSVFSRALTAGEQVDTEAGLKKGFWALLKNAIFFMPKREVVCEFELAPRDFPRQGTLPEVNRYLEEWYNKPYRSVDGTINYGEPLTLVSYSCWREDFPEVQKREEEKHDLDTVSNTIKQKVAHKIAELGRVSPNQIMASQDLSQDLGLDSLDLAELVTFLDDEFEISGINPGDLTTVGRVYLIAAKVYKKKEVLEPTFHLTNWLNTKDAERLAVPEARSIPEAFLKMAEQDINRVICADTTSGVLTYFDVKKRALLLAAKIRKLPGKRIGILLPASTTVNILILACQMADKVPVMINWTVGGKHLDTVVEVSGIEVVLTSWAFLDNLENVDITRIEEMIVVLEEIRAEISFLEMIRATCLAYSSCETLLRKAQFAHLKQQFYEEAVVLFTSGTEANPKGVPLTHGNLLENQRALLELVPITSGDRLLAMLPPFHSFGFAITGVMPLISGLKVVFYPNPTDSKRLAKAANYWQTSVLCTAPTFLKNILQVAEPGSLRMVRYIVSGAEKAPQELFDLKNRHCPLAHFFEGYGITECSPVLTLNTSENRENGVGMPIPGVDLKVVDPESCSPLSHNAIGLILARGPNVFNGYLNKDARNPFIELDGNRWYNTGDLGKILDNGSLVLAGRMKRFVKIGGEMLSLAAIEEAFSPTVQAKQDAEGLPQLAVIPGPEEGGRPKLVLFLTASLDLVQANQMLRQSGFSNLVKIDKVCTIDQIPMTGTGKIAYRQLEKMMPQFA